MKNENNNKDTHKMRYSVPIIYDLILDIAKAMLADPEMDSVPQSVVDRLKFQIEDFTIDLKDDAVSVGIIIKGTERDIEIVDKFIGDNLSEWSRPQLIEDDEDKPDNEDE